MATVFMKWLETTPGDYDRGIQLLTLGRLTPLKERIATDYIQPGDRVLEIGCGTGALALMMAQRGASLNLVTHLLDPTPDCRAATFAASQIVGDYHDAVALERVRQIVGVSNVSLPGGSLRGAICERKASSSACCLASAASSSSCSRCSAASESGSPSAAEAARYCLARVRSASTPQPYR